MAEGTALQVLAGDATWSVTHGDCIELLRSLPDCSVDAVVCDPPYELNFMGRTWDRSGIAFDPETWRAVFRVLKPGAHLLAFGGTRTFHRIAVAIEDAGFTIRDSLAWLHGQGFPKNLDVSKAIDGHFGNVQPVVGTRPIAYPDSPSGYGSVSDKSSARAGRVGIPGQESSADLAKGRPVTAAVSPESERWDGWGTALKPSHEPIILARKPLIGTLAENLLEHGTGALNIDGCRVAHAGAADLAAHDSSVAAIKSRGGSMSESWKNSSDLAGANDVNSSGRWPPNVLLSHADGCRRLTPAVVQAHPTWDTPNRQTEPSAFTGGEVSKVRHGNGSNGEASADKRYATEGATAFAMLPGERRDATETVERWECVDGCAVAELNLRGDAAGVHNPGGARAGSSTPKQTDAKEWQGPESQSTDTMHRFGDGAQTSRYFPQFQDDEPPFNYLPKPARGEVEAGLAHFRQRSGGEATDREDNAPGTVHARAGSGGKSGIRNVHPTKKSVDLMRWLVRLVTPPGGIVLDPFTGSGATGVAAICESKRFIGAELNDTDAEPFVSIARARLHHAEGREFIPRESLRAAEPPKQTALFSFAANGGER